MNIVKLNIIEYNEVQITLWTYICDRWAFLKQCMMSFRWSNVLHAQFKNAQLISRIPEHNKNLISHVNTVGTYYKHCKKRIMHVIRTIRPVLYVAFLSRRMQFKQWIMRWIISLSIVWIAFDATEIWRIKQASEIYFSVLTIDKSTLPTVRFHSYCPLLSTSRAKIWTNRSLSVKSTIFEGCSIFDMVMDITYRASCKIDIFDRKIDLFIFHL